MPIGRDQLSDEKIDRKKKKAYELGLINHGSQNHLWTAQALVKLSTRQLLLRHWP